MIDIEKLSNRTQDQIWKEIQTIDLRDRLDKYTDHKLNYYKRMAKLKKVEFSDRTWTKVRAEIFRIKRLYILSLFGPSGSATYIDKCVAFMFSKKLIHDIVFTDHPFMSLLSKNGKGSRGAFVSVPLRVGITMDGGI